MTSPGLTAPLPIPAVGGDDVARVELWAARQRAELSRLSLALRSARMKADKAEQAERDGPPEVEPTDELLSVIASMLDTAVQEADRAVEAARNDAEEVVAAERVLATVHLRSLGLDPVAVLGPAGGAGGEIPDVARPVAVDELWQLVEVGVRPAAPALAAVPAGPAAGPPPGDDPEVRFDDAELVDAFWGDVATEPPSRPVVMAGPAAPPPETPSLPRIATEPEMFDVFWNGSEVFDGFWSEAEGEQSRRLLRDRLRRRATQGQP